MSDPLPITYFFDGGLTSREGKHPLSGQPGTIVAGPGTTLLGPCPKAMRFGGTSYLSTTLAAADVDTRCFTLRMIVKPSAGKGNQLLCACETVPFQLLLTPGETPEQRGLLALVDAQAHGWQGLQTLRVGMTLKVDEYVLVDLVFDHDTLGVFVNLQLAHAFGFADGRLRTAASGRLMIGGTAEDPARRFLGELAALTLRAGMPPWPARTLEASRNTPLWHITRQYTLVNGPTVLGRAAGNLEWDGVAGAHLVRFEKGMVMCDPRLGAGSVDGDLYRGYLALPEAERRALGPLASDSINHPNYRWVHFLGGGLFYSRQTGTAAVTGRIFQHYLKHGGPRGIAGLPRKNATRVTGGREQIFQRARYYDHTPSGQAFALRGGILDKFLRSGGIGGCGFPQSDENPVFREGRQVGARAEFQKCSIFYRDGQGYVVPPHFLRAHAAGGGLEGDLGFPTSDLRRTGPASAPTEYQSFERGTIVRLPGQAEPRVCPEFQIYLGSLDTRESEGLFQGQNDPYFFLTINRSQLGQEEEIVYERRDPPTGSHDGHNIVPLDETLDMIFSTADPNVVYRLRADVWEADSFGGGDDDHLGDISFELSLGNCWGLAENEGVLMAEDRKAKLYFSVKPRYNRDNYTEKDWLFFNFDNEGSSLPWRSYAAAFTPDVETDFSPDDIITDPLGTIWAPLYYLLAAVVTSYGNCWGFAAETNRAWLGTSLFSPPLNRFTWDQTRREINIAHVSQLGLHQLAWQVLRFVLHATQNPVRAFQESREAAAGGRLPLLVVMQDLNPLNYWHVVLPYSWDDSEAVWTIKTYDSNTPGRNDITIDPSSNRWKLRSGGHDLAGGNGSGARLFHVPWSDAGRIPAKLPRPNQFFSLIGAAIGFLVFWEMVESGTFAGHDGANLDFTRSGPADRHRLNYMLIPVPTPAGPAGAPRLWARPANTGVVNYVQELKLAAGVSAQKPWRYALGFGGGELYFSGTGQAGDRVRLSFERVGGRGSRCTVSGSRAGTFTAVYAARTDADGGQMKMILERLPLEETPVQLSWKPGLEGFEVIAPGDGVARLTVTSARGGVGTSRRYLLPLAGGSRVRISSVAETGELLVYSIAALNGVSWGSTVLQPEV